MMDPFHNAGGARLWIADSFELMAALPENSVDSLVTDPPYGIRFMGKAWDGADIISKTEGRGEYRRASDADPRAGKNGGHNSIAAEAGKYDRSTDANRQFQLWTEGWARQALRVLKPGAHLVCFSSTRTYHRMAAGIEDAGFDVRDQLAWVFGQGFPKSLNFDGEWDGWGTALKPGWEPICLARKPLIGTVEKNLQRYATGAINIDECRVGHSDEVIGRWPANIMHDGSPEVLAAFPDAQGQAGRAKSGGAKNNNVYGDFGTNHTNHPEPRVDASKSAARFFYCPKASKSDREEGCADLPRAHRRRERGPRPDSAGMNSPRAGPVARADAETITPRSNRPN